MANESAKSPPLIEENVNKLRKALRHWQTLELDYEGLKDEIQGLSEDKTTKAQLFQVAHDFGPEKLDDKDLEELFQINGKLRLPSQIIDVLTKRAEYVRKNIETLRKQLTDLEKERNAMLLVNRDKKEAEPETALDQADITEQLDENDNIVSSYIQRVDDPISEQMQIDDAKVVPDSSNALAIRPKDIGNLENGRKPQTNENLGRDNSENGLISNRTQIDQRNGATLQPINSDDTEEEAKLRQEMLQYGLPEVGNIVAELEMADANEDENEDENDLDDIDDDDDYDDSEEEESEDEHGRSTRSAMSDKYRRKMEKLQKEMGPSMENVGPLPETTERVDRPSAAEAARKAAIARHEAAKSVLKNSGSDSEMVKDKARKRVAFAGSLDIASTTKAHNDDADTNMKKISRFKAARSAQPQTPLFAPPMNFSKAAEDTHEGRAGRIVADTLVERSRPPKQSEPAAPDGDDFDEEMQKRQIALEHHRLRNKKIHEQGGYIGGGELDNWGEEHAAPTVLDEQTCQPRKVSRFKAARLKG